MNKKLCDAKGVTLIELVVVLAVFAIISASVVVSTESLSTKSLNAVCLELRNDLRFAQRSAVAEGRKYQVVFDISNNYYYILYYNSAGISTRIKEKRFEQGIILDNTTAVGSSVIYTARGTTGNACTITLRNATHYANLTVNVGSGRVTQKKFEKYSNYDFQ